MRDLVTRTITAAALAAGLPLTADAAGQPVPAVYPELENAAKEKVFLPARRVELHWLDEELTQQGWRVARVRAESVTVCRTRYAVYKVVQPVRVLVRGDDQTWLDDFCRALLLTIPGRVPDAAGNPVRVKAVKAVRKGYTYASIRIEEAPTQALHVHFSGIIHKDVDTGFITNITIHPKYEVGS